MKRIAWVILGSSIPFICNATSVGIIDYKPSVFSEHASQPFFFSIGKKLKYGNAIREDAPTLFEAGWFDGDINEVYPSPDQKKAVVVVGNSLYLAQPGKPTTKLLQPFERKNLRDLQWDSQSRYIFVPRYIFPNNDHRFVSGLPSTLLRIDTNDPIIVRELISSSQFRMLETYFPLNDDSVCFDSATPKGDVIWQCWISGVVHTVQRLEVDRITFVDGTTVKDKPFFSLPMRGGEISLALGGYSLTMIPNSLQVDFFHSNKPTVPIFRLQGYIERLKGNYFDGFRDGESTVLPGGRYAVVTIRFRTVVVVDSDTGLYKELPKNSSVYENINSYGNPDIFRIVEPEKGFFMIDFKASKRFRTNYKLGPGLDRQ